MAGLNAKNKILNCAEDVVLRDGVARLTLDAVAAEAGLSKGGVLYHFPSKDDLIRGMVARLIEQVEAEMARRVAADPEPVGRLMRAYVGSSFPPSPVAEHHTRMSAALLAAMLTNAGLLQPVCEQFRAWQERLLDDGLEPSLVHIVKLATDGLWMAGVLGMPGPDTDTRLKVIEQLFAMTRK